LAEAALGERGTVFALLALQRGARARFLLEQALELAPVQLEPHEGDEARAGDGAAVLGERVEVARAQLGRVRVEVVSRLAVRVEALLLLPVERAIGGVRSRVAQLGRQLF